MLLFWTKIPHSGEHLYEVKEVAEILAVDERLVIRAIVDGRLATTNVGSGRRPLWRIRESAVEAFLSPTEHPRASSPSTPTSPIRSVKKRVIGKKFVMEKRPPHRGQAATGEAKPAWLVELERAALGEE